MTNTKTTPRRWHALALAALMIAGGTLAVPQAAEAGTVTSKSVECRNSGSTCVLKVNTRNDVYFRLAGVGIDARYTVRTPGGRLLCRGVLTYNHGNRSCWFGTYTGPVKITVKTDGRWSRVYASY